MKFVGIVDSYENFFSGKFQADNFILIIFLASFIMFDVEIFREY